MTQLNAQERPNCKIQVTESGFTETWDMNKEQHCQVIVNQHTAKRLNFILHILVARDAVLSTAFLKPMGPLPLEGEKNYQTLSYRGQYYQGWRKVFC